VHRRQDHVLGSLVVGRSDVLDIAHVDPAFIEKVRIMSVAKGSSHLQTTELQQSV
jgi:hypothetical protein